MDVILAKGLHTLNDTNIYLSPCDFSDNDDDDDDDDNDDDDEDEDDDGDGSSGEGGGLKFTRRNKLYIHLQILQDSRSCLSGEGLVGISNSTSQYLEDSAPRQDKARIRDEKERE